VSRGADRRDRAGRPARLPSGELRLLQPREAAALPDAGPVEWAPVAPYWSVLWRSGVALACELDGVALRGLRVVEQAGRQWPVETRVRDVVRVHRLQLG
jgi:hypothetical protein